MTEREIVARVRADSKMWSLLSNEEDDLLALCDAVERLERERDVAVENLSHLQLADRDEVIRLTAENERLREDAERMEEVDIDALAVLACCRYNRMSGDARNFAAIADLLAKQESTMMRWRETVACVLNVLRPTPVLDAALRPTGGTDAE